MPNVPPGTIRVDCASKLNLFLEVLARRNDGFHEIETIMVAVNRYDSLYFAKSDSSRIQLTCRWASGIQAGAADHSKTDADETGDLPQDSDNIVWKAVDLLRRQADIQGGARIRIVKRIPTMAGLGGASSNAAAAMLAANRAWRLGWTRRQLSEVSAEIGSDVPFFFARPNSGPTIAMACGRGERISTVRSCGMLHIVVARPPAGLSTPAVYRRCTPADNARSSEPLIAALAAGRSESTGGLLFNRLQTAAEQLSPWIGRVAAVFEGLDFLGHSMSGSGSSYFGLCRHARHARRLAAQVRAAGVGQVFAAESTSAACRFVGTTA